MAQIQNLKRSIGDQMLITQCKKLQYERMAFTVLLTLHFKNFEMHFLKNQ